MILYELTQKRAFMRYVSKNLDIRFIVDREAVGRLSQENWYSRSNGTLVHSKTKKPLTHYIFEMFNGWEPKKIFHKDGNYSNCLSQNLSVTE